MSKHTYAKDPNRANYEAHCAKLANFNYSDGAKFALVITCDGSEGYVSGFAFDGDRVAGVTLTNDRAQAARFDHEAAVDAAVKMVRFSDGLAQIISVPQ